MFGFTKQHWMVTVTSLVLLSLAATGAISRRMQLAAKTALFLSSDNTVDTTASTPIVPHSNPAFANGRESWSAKHWLTSADDTGAPLSSVAPFVILAADLIDFPGKLPALGGSLQTCCVRWQV